MRQGDFGVDDRVVVTEPINLQPYTTLREGETGTVREVVDEMGVHGVVVEMDQPHKGLCNWNNEALVVEPESSYMKTIVRAGKKAAALIVGAGGFALGVVKAHALVLGAAAVLLLQ